MPTEACAGKFHHRSDVRHDPGIVEPEQDRPPIRKSRVEAPPELVGERVDPVGADQPRDAARAGGQRGKARARCATGELIVEYPVPSIGQGRAGV